jgi:hypothetical protein
MLRDVAAPGVVLYKTFSYRGAPEEWGNTYHFVGDAPSNPADWRSLVDALVALEAQCLWDGVTIERAICYEDTDHSSVYSYDLSAFAGTVPGVYDVGGGFGVVQEGGSSYMCRWNTGRISSKGKPIYLRKYWHPAISAPTNPDVVAVHLVAAVDTFGSAVMAASGDWPGIAGPDGVAPVGHLAETYTNYRTLRKGRRRPT